MTTSHGSDTGARGSSRYDSSPVGGSGEGSRSRPPYEPAQPPPRPTPTPGYGGQQPPPEPDPAPGYGQQQPPPDPGYPPEPPADEGGGHGHETPEQSGEPETPEGGYGPEEPGYDDGKTPQPPAPPASHPCPPSMTCDTRGIDDLQCEAKGVKKESDELAAVEAALATRRTAFETARSAYTLAREAAAQAVKDLDRRVDDLLDDTRCLLNKDEVACIDEAFGQVIDCLDDCPDDQGCCVDEGCGIQGESWTVGQMDDLRERVEKAEKCFDEVLVTEPTALAARVTALQALVDELAEALRAEPREEANRLYARAKRARWILDQVWGGFTDVNEFQNCLCRGLTCSLQGRQWLAQLAGKKAYQECQEAARRRRCQWLRDNMVDETLATQLVLCPPTEPCGNDGDGATYSSS